MSMQLQTRAVPRARAFRYVQLLRYPVAAHLLCGGTCWLEISAPTGVGAGS
jgi:hypothetical protein